MLLVRTGKRKDHRGRPIQTYGFRFWYKGRLHKRFFKSRELAVEAEKRERARLELAAWEGVYGSFNPRLTTVEDAVKRYLDAKARKRSLYADRIRLTWWQEFFKRRGVNYLQEISPEHLDLARNELTALNRKTATVERYLAVLRTLFNLAIRRWGVLRKNPTEAIDWPKSRPPDYPIPTVEEIRRLIDTADEIVRPLVIVAAYTGLREGDVIRLTAEDLRIRPGWIKGYGSKGGKPVWLPVMEELKTALESRGVIAGRLFRWPDGRPFSRFPRGRWDKCKGLAGLPEVRFHDLRHAVGTMLSEAGVPPRTIMEYLGHSHLRVTERYTRPQEAGLEHAAKTIAKRLSGKAHRTNA